VSFCLASSCSINCLSISALSFSFPLVIRAIQIKKTHTHTHTHTHVEKSYRGRPIHTQKGAPIAPNKAIFSAEICENLSISVCCKVSETGKGHLEQSRCHVSVSLHCRPHTCLQKIFTTIRQVWTRECRNEPSGLVVADASPAARCGEIPTTFRGKKDHEKGSLQ
jgi:hypothetical protein